ncbi:MAG: energy-coupling factor transporter transmembrane component T [Clostridiales bacterium]|nr:energy-coupling factor transporter transmembrane component T [Clostridiales bacterium]
MRNSAFAEKHPLVTTVYYGMVVGITMFSDSIILNSLSLIFAFLYSVLLRKNVFLDLAKTVAFIVILATLINILFTHNGSTVLFYIGGNRITLEAFLYGLSMSLMFSAVIIWFFSFNTIMTSDKMIYIFGKLTPTLGLTVSMIFRLIPLLKSRFEEVKLGQLGLGRGNVGSFIQKIKIISKEISILVSWSLESSIITADSMSARGYGLKGRTSFHLFKFLKEDVITIGIILLLALVVIAGKAKGVGLIYYYPIVQRGVTNLNPLITIVTITSYLILLALPILVDSIGELIWKKSSYEI